MAPPHCRRNDVVAFAEHHGADREGRAVRTSSLMVFRLVCRDEIPSVRQRGWFIVSLLTARLRRAVSHGIAPEEGDDGRLVETSPDPRRRRRIRVLTICGRVGDSRGR